MTQKLFIFGLGFTGLRFARAVRLLGWDVVGTVTTADKAAWISNLGIRVHVFAGDEPSTDIDAELASSTHVISTIPPIRGWKDGSAETADPVLKCHQSALTKDRPWTAYLSTTGVYGDKQGDWVDETAPALGGTNAARQRADEDWRALGRSHIFRLPGIYGPGRSTLERAENGQLSRVDKPGQVFSRIHVDDIVQTLIASAMQPAPGEIYNVSDDLPASGHGVEDYACDLLGITPPPLVPFEKAGLSPRGGEFYSQCRRVRNAKIKSALGVRLIYPTYKEGLQGCLASRHTKA